MARIGKPGRWRIAAIGILIPLAAIASLVIWQDYEARREATITNLELKSAQINAQLEDFIHTTEAVSKQLAGSLERIYPNLRLSLDNSEMAGGASEFLSEFLDDNLNYSGALVVNRLGTIIAASDTEMVGSRVPAQRFFDSVSGSNNFVVSDVFVPPNDGPPNAMFAYPLRDPNGIPASYLLLKTELSTISSMLDMSVGFPESAKAGIFDSTGVVLAGTGYVAPHPGAAVGKNISGSPVWAHAETQPTEAWFGPGLDKVDRIIYFDYPDQTPWVTTVAFEQAELFRPLWNRVYALSGGLGFALIGFLVLIEILRRRENQAWTIASREQRTMRSVLDGATDGIVVADLDGRIAYANGRVFDLLAVTNEMSGTIDAESPFLSEALSGSLADEDRTKLSTLLMNRAEPSNERIFVNSAPPKELEIVAYPIFGSDAVVSGRTLIVHDITEENRVNRMKSDFVAYASHQLRTPLSGILASSELLLNPDSTDESPSKWGTLIHNEALRMRSTISTLLNLSEMDSGQMKLERSVVDLNSIVQSVVRNAGAHSSKHNFEIDVTGSSRYAICDRDKIIEVVQNLVDNAVKYSPDGGLISITASSNSKDQVVVSVADEGVGFDERDRESLFRPYERASARSRGFIEGTGLGLYMVRSLVELHGGSVWAESREGGGSVFAFTVPSADDSSPQPSDATPAAEANSIEPVPTGAGRLGRRLSSSRPA